VNREGKILLLVRPLHSFAASFVSIFFAVYLSLLGLPLWQVGLALTGGMLSSTLFNLGAGFLADRLGRRKLLSQMNVPTRQSYVMAIVKPEERSRVSGLINLPRSLTLAFGPSIAAYLMQFIGLSFPFLAAGVVKSAYYVALWFTFRGIKPPEEE